MCSLHCLTDVLPVSLTDLTYDFSIRAHNRASIGGIGAFLGSSDIHLQRTINAINNAGRNHNISDNSYDIVPWCLCSFNFHGNGVELGLVLGRIQRSRCHIGSKRLYLSFDKLWAWPSLPCRLHIFKQALNTLHHHLSTIYSHITHENLLNLQLFTQ